MAGEPEETDVLVVGGGPAGAATALFLRQLGHAVNLLDAAHFPRDKVCGEGVSPEAWRLLGALGLRDAVQALAPRALHGMQVTSPDGTRFAGSYRSQAAGFAVRRGRLDAVLLQAARTAGVEVQEGCRASAPVRRGGRVAGVATDDGRRWTARLVVSADGRGSMLARRLGLLGEHGRLRRYAVRGYWQDMAGLGSHGEMHVGGGGYCGIAPLSATEGNVTFVLPPPALRAAGGDLEGFYRSALRARWPAVAERLEHARLDGPPRAVGPLALDARAVTAPDVLMVGDAAGFYDPFTGEGVTLALSSAEMAAQAADRFLRGRGASALASYAEERREATRDKFRLNRLLQQVVAWPALADHVARRLSRRPDLADQLVGIAGDFVPARTALRLRFVADLLLA